MKPSYCEVDIVNTLFAINNGLNVRQAERDYDISRSTLCSRLFDTFIKSEGAAPLQKLSLVQEQYLTD